MKVLNNSRVLQLSGLLIGTLVWLANNVNPPCGNTGAPFDGSCASSSCHGTANTNGYDGTVSLDGLPATISANTTYPLTLTVTYTAGSPVKAGFQVVAVGVDNSNAGSWANINGEASTASCGTRQYIEHHNGKLFSGGSVTWNFNWTSPATVNGNQVTFYYIANFTNNNNASTGDWPLAANSSYPFSGPPPVTATISSSTNVTCNGGSNGSATVEPGGGISPYTYHWSNNQTTQTAINLTAGTYTVTVTGSSGTGTATAVATITQPPAIALTASATGTITCSNPTATGTASATGGNGGFTLDWSNGQQGSPVTFTAGGTYTVTATDNQGCTKTATVSVAANTAQPNAVAQASGQLSCTNTTVTVSGTGSSTGATITYAWSTTDGHIVSGTNTITATVDQAGTYTLTVTNTNNGCTKTASATVTSIAQPPNASATGGTITCTNPTTTINGNSTTQGVTYSWTGPNGFTSNLQNPTVSAGGTYTLTVHNPANSCTATATASVTANTAPPSASASAGPAITCAAPSSQVIGTSGTSGATFAWTGPNGFTSSQQSPTVTVGGVYNLVVTGPNGCTQTASATVVQNNAPPGVTASGGNLSCLTPIVMLNATSGTSGITYSWTGPGGFTSTLQSPTVNTGGTYSVTVTNPANSCTSTASAVVTGNTTPPSVSAAAGQPITCSNPTAQLTSSSGTSGATFAWTGPNGFTSTQANPTVSVGGVYNLVVTGPNSCTATASVTENQNTTLPGAGATGGVINCTTPSITMLGTTTSSHAKFAWSGPGGNSSQQNFTVTVAGTYNLVVTDTLNGCTSTATSTVTSNTTAPVASAQTPSNLNCFNATVQINGTASSQGANFIYAWTTANGNIVSGANTLTPVVNQGGDYHLLVTNTDNGCTATTSVTVIQHPPVTATISSVTSVSCNGNANGAATAAAGGGNSAYSYLWSNNATTASISNLTAGSYIVTITDGENCTATATAVVSQPAVLAANASATGETSLGANNGTATAAPTGGTSPYTYLWNTGATTASLSNLAPGNYTVTVTDNHGCTNAQTVTVNSFTCSLASSLATTNITCSGANNGTAAVTLTGASNPITYIWSNGATTSSISGLSAGTYTVQILDGNNCPAAQTAVITEPAVLAANATSTNVTAAGATNGTATAAPTGGTNPYTYQWSNSQTTAMIVNLAPGTYTVTVTDSHNCTAVQTVTVNPFNCTVTATPTTVNVSCSGGSNGQATVVLNGGSSPYHYAWNNGATTATISSLIAGNYTATVTDGSGCIVVQTVTITEPTLLQTSVTPQNVPCPESTTGSATVVISGGTPAYQIAWSGGGNGQNLGVGAYSYTVTDANGCTAAQSFNIVSNDQTPPALSCPGNIVICGADVVDYPTPVATDNCNLHNAVPVLTGGQASGTAFSDGITTQTFQVTDASGNTGTCSFTVTVYPVPDVVVVSSVDETNSGGNGSIDVTSSGGTGPYVYIWNKDGAFFSNSEDLTGLHAGVYTLTISDAHGCTTILAPVTIKDAVGTQDPGSLMYVQLVPNPVSSAFHLNFNGFQPVAAQILNMQGRLVQLVPAETLADQVNVDQLPAGLYYLHILGEDGRSTTLKWVKSE